MSPSNGMKMLAQARKPVLGKTFTYRSITWLHFVTITLGVVGLPVKKHYRPIYAAQ